MGSYLTKLFTAILLSLSLIYTVQADVQDTLPDIGTTAGDTLSINQELILGDYYTRQLRAGVPIIHDPVLNTYINQLGQRLVQKADAVKTPFSFFLINNDQINAFAFFGGNVVLHSALFWETEDEGQLASVMAHEIAHVTQRHLARAMEQQRRNAPIAWASTLGSVLLTMANPQLGMAALTTSIAGTQQGIISFTQSNEQEADRIGIRILTKAGFNAQSMPEFMQKLADRYRYASKPPEILLTHPLPESRLADTRNRANQYAQRTINSSLEYYLAKIRVLTMYQNNNNNSVQFRNILITEFEKGTAAQRTAAQYGRAIIAYRQKKFDEARQIAQALTTKYPNNIWLLDLLSDIDIEQKRPRQAVTRLENALKRLPKNPVLQINLANAYIQAGQYKEAITLLSRYTFFYPTDVNGWELLEMAAAKSQLRSQELAARAEKLVLIAQFDQAIRLLADASQIAQPKSQEQARYHARLDQIKAMKKKFQQYKL